MLVTVWDLQMGVRVFGSGASLLPDGRFMDRDVHGSVEPPAKLAGKVLRKPTALVLVKLQWQGNLERPRRDRVPFSFSVLDRLPKLLSFHRDHAVRENEFRMNQTRLPPKIPLSDF